MWLRHCTADFAISSRPKGFALLPPGPDNGWLLHRQSSHTAGPARPNQKALDPTRAIAVPRQRVAAA